MKLGDLVPLVASHARVCIYDREDHIVKRIDDISMLDMYTFNTVCCENLQVAYLLAYKKDSYGHMRLNVWCRV